MLEIIFQNREDASRFHHLLGDSSASIQIEMNPKEGQYKVVHQEKQWNPQVKNTFVKFVSDYKQYDWAKLIVEHRFFFEDEHEQEQILEIFTSMLEGHRKDLVSIKELDEQEHKLFDTVEQLFADHVSFLFDSFVRFRLRSYHDYMEHLVGISIDEYKMEQEYQMFIQMLREILINRQTSRDILHVVVQDSVSFYDELFREITRKELARLVDRKLFANYPIYIDSIAIAPLLSIAPRTIYLYSDDTDQPLIRTLANIFEERLVVRSQASFFCCADELSK